MKDPFKLPKGVGDRSKGLMYYDHSKDPFSVKLEGAMEYYSDKYNGTIAWCEVHPDTEIDKKPKGIKVVKDNYIMPNHLWIGVNDG